jgi:predicted enzyme related to lactoylglutathione lyase
VTHKWISLAWAIKYVTDMDRAIAFYRDVLGLAIKSQSSKWSEFDTGKTTLALHLVAPEELSSAVEIGFSVPDIQAFYAEMSARGVTFTQPPTPQGDTVLAQFLDSDGNEVSVTQA